MYVSPMDHLPIWAVFIATFAIILFSLEVGFRLGIHRSKRPGHEQDAPVGSIVGASLVLVGFMLAFTFSMATERFEYRRTLVVEGANAIEKTYLRAALLPEPDRTMIRNLLREAVDYAVQAGLHPKKAQREIAGSEILEKQLWTESVAAAKRTSGSPMTSLFIQSLNEAMDVHTKRINWIFIHRIPRIIWVSLYLVSVLAMAAMGYQSGLSGARSSVPAFLLGLSFSVVILLIVALDRPSATISEVGQQAMIDLQAKISAPKSPSQSSRP
jgi:hypothetical protein